MDTGILMFITNPNWDKIIAYANGGPRPDYEEAQEISIIILRIWNLKSVKTTT